MSAELIDLDFTLPPPPRVEAPPARTGAARPPEDTPKPREDGPRPEAEIGTLRAGHAGNFISYARSGGARGTPAPAAPIVLVEDDEITRRVLERVLATFGYPVRAAADSQALMRLMRSPPLPRLILLDVELPQVSGFKILAALRQHPQTSAIPLVMLTARSEAKDLLHALSLGADGYLSKPVTIAALRATLERLLRRPGEG